MSDQISLSEGQIVQIHEQLMGAGTDEEREGVIDLAVAEILAADSAVSDNGQEVRNWLKSFGFVDKSTYRQRIAKCFLCPNATKLFQRSGDAKPVLKCNKCGCIMNIKARLSNGKCPVGNF